MEMTQLGQGRARICCGDALALLRSLPPQSVDGVIFDPPYNSGGTFSTARKADTGSKYLEDSGRRAQALPSYSGDNMDMRSFTLFLREVFFAALQATRPGGILGAFIDFRNYGAVADAMQAAGVIWRGCVVWDKVHSRTQLGRFRNQCEYFLWGSRGALPLDRPVPPLPGLIRCPNVSAQAAEHQTQKPIDVMRFIVQIVPEGGTVCDPFMGSGTTGVAAIELGRRFVGAELDGQYFDTARRRISSACEQISLFDQIEIEEGGGSDGA